MKKKLFSLSLIITCLATISTGTLAFFQAKDVAHNVITSGGVDIDLVEKAENPDEDPNDPTDDFIDFEDVDGIVPGQDVSKIVYVQNTGASDAWVRIRADVSITLADGTEGSIDVLTIDYNKADWIYKADAEGTGYWYYKDPLPPPTQPESGDPVIAETTPLFTKVTFIPDMDNSYQGCTTRIDVSAQAVQVANNPMKENEDPTIDDVLEAAGWPGETPAAPETETEAE